MTWRVTQDPPPLRITSGTLARCISCASGTPVLVYEEDYAAGCATLR